MPGVVLPSTGFEEYAGNYALLTAAGWDYAGTPLSNAPGVAHAGSWACKFVSGHGDFIRYPAATASGTGLTEIVFDATFWMAHDDGQYATNAPLYEPEKIVVNLLSGAAGVDPYPALTVPLGAWCLGITGGAGNRYRTPLGTFPGDGVYRKVRMHVELDGNGTHANGLGVAQIWIDDVLQLDEHAAALRRLTGNPTYDGTYGGVEIGDAGGLGFTYFLLDDLNPTTAGARARCFLVA